MLHALLEGKNVSKPEKVRLTMRVTPKLKKQWVKFLKEQKKAGSYSSLSEVFEEIALKIIKTKGHINV